MITVNREELIDALNAANLARPVGYCPVREAESLLLDADNGRIVGTNLERWVHAHLKTIVGRGKLLIDFKPVINTLKALTDTEVVIRPDADTPGAFNLESGDDKYTFLAYDGDLKEFPDINSNISFTPDLLIRKKDIDTVLSVSSGEADDHRPHINGVLFDADNDKLASTDGGCLAFIDFFGNTRNRLVPKTGMAIARRIMAGKKSSPEGWMQLDVDYDPEKMGSGFAGFSLTGKGEMSVHLFVRQYDHDNKFPDYIDLVEATRQKASRISVDKQRLINLCDRVLPLRSKSFRGSYITFNDGIKVEHYNFHVGEYGLKAEIPTNWGSVSPEIETVLDFAQVRAAVLKMGGDEVEIDVAGTKNPVVFKDTESSYRHLIMPMKYTPKPGEADDAPAQETQEA